MTKHRDKIRKAFAASLRKKRKEKAISQEQLAELAGLHVNYISLVECADVNISLDSMARLAKALHCNIKDFFSG